MNRRNFLRLAGSGLVVASAPTVALAEPVRRFWQVSRGAPVRDPLADLRAEGRVASFSEPIILTGGHGYTYYAMSYAVDELDKIDALHARLMAHDQVLAT